MPAAHEDHPATIVSFENYRMMARMDDGRDVHVTGQATGHAKLVPGARVLLWRVRETSTGLEAARAELDPADRENYLARLASWVVEDKLAAAKREKKPYSPPLVAGQFRAEVIPSEVGEKKTRLRLEDGRVALTWSAGRFKAIPGVKVIVRRTEDQRGELWAVEVERDEEHREQYERLVAPDTVEKILEDNAYSERRRGAPALDLPNELRGTITRVERLDGVVTVPRGDTTLQIGFITPACDGFSAEVGTDVTVRRLRRRADGALVAEDLAIDAATKELLRQRKRAAVDVDKGALASQGDPVIEAAVLDRGDDAAWDALERWLVARDDPRGELVRLERALERAEAAGASATEKAELQSARDAHFEKHRAFLLGDLADPRAEIDLTFHRGFVRSAALWEGKTPVADRLKALLRTPVMRLVESLVLDGSEADVGRQLLAWPIKSLRSLVIGHAPFTPLGASLSRATPSLSRLVDLELVGTEVELPPGAVLAPLQRFAISSCDIGRTRVMALAAVSTPLLRTLELGLGKPARKEDAVRLEDVELLLGAAVERGTSISTLGLTNTTLTNALCRRLPTHGILRGLEALDLSNGTMTDGGAAALGCAPEAFAKLQKLDASANLLTPLGADYVRRACASADVSRQRPGYGTGQRVPALGGPR